MRNLLAAGLCAATLALSPAPATAGPLQLRHVAPDAQFVVHIDIEAMRESEAGRMMIEIISNAADDAFDEMRGELGIDPRRNIDGATVYGAAGDDEEGLVIIVHGNGALAEALAKAREGMGDALKRSDGGVDFEQWDAGDEDLYIFEASRRDATTVVIAFEADRLVRAVRVLAGDEEGLRGEAAEAFGEPRAGAFVFASVAGDMGLDEPGQASNLLKLSDRIIVQVGGDESLEVSVEVTADSHDDAKNLVGLMQGAVAMGRIAAGQPDMLDDEERAAVLGLVDGLEVASEGRRVSLRASFDPAWLAKMIEEHAD